MESGDIEESDFEMPQYTFWSTYCDLKHRINNLKRKSNSNLSPNITHQICAEVKEKILDQEEDLNLSVLQNKIRKLSIGADLYKDICSVQRHVSYLEIDKAVSKILEEEKYNLIANKIESENKLEIRREKYFKIQALNTIKEIPTDEIEIGKQLEEEKCNDEVTQQEDEDDILNINGEEQIRPQPRFTLADKIVNGSVPSQGVDISFLETARNVLSETARDDGNLNENLEINSDVALEMRVSDVPMPHFEISLAEIGTTENNGEDGSQLDIQELERMLEEGIHELPQDVSDFLSDEILHTNGLDDLPALSPAYSERRKRIQPTFDRTTFISNYAERAQRLNRNINIEGVQIYEGPPSILQAFKTSVLMTTSAIKNKFYNIKRSSVINNLYQRNLKTEKMPYKTFSQGLQGRRTTEQESLQAMEEVRISNEKHSEIGKFRLRDAPTDISKNIPQNEEEILNHQHNLLEEEMQRLCGTPISRILQRTSTPVKNIGQAVPWTPPRSHRTQNLQGTTIDQPCAEPWFISLNQPTPSAKWREFKYVRKCLEKIWKRKEENEYEKNASLREMLESNQDWNKENMLTLLRVLDKMSLQKEIIFKGKGENLLIYPFEMPYVTEIQYSFKNEIQKF